MLILSSDGHCAISSRLNTRIHRRNVHPRRSVPLPPAVLHRLLSWLFPLLPLPPAACHL